MSPQNLSGSNRLYKDSRTKLLTRQVISKSPCSTDEGAAPYADQSVCRVLSAHDTVPNTAAYGAGYATLASAIDNAQEVCLAMGGGAI